MGEQGLLRESRVCLRSRQVSLHGAPCRVAISSCAAVLPLPLPEDGCRFCISAQAGLQSSLWCLLQLQRGAEQSPEEVS